MTLIFPPQITRRENEAKLLIEYQMNRSGKSFFQNSPKQGSKESA